LKRVEEDVCSFKVGGGQGIVGVGLVRPKKGEWMFGFDM
jgi:hypothetical protein